jgi:hypothetical protein
MDRSTARARAIEERECESVRERGTGVERASRPGRTRGGGIANASGSGRGLEAAKGARRRQARGRSIVVVGV